MYDHLQDNVGVFDYDELANQLLEQGLETSPSQLHGCLCGLLAAGASNQPEAGLAGLTRVLEVELYGELAEQVMLLYSVTATALLDDEFDFHPLLPDDEDELAERTMALASWCRGFVAGFAQATAAAGKGQQLVAADSSEIIRDFVAIAQAGTSEEEEEDEAEASYAELVEYLRFATLNVYMDSLDQDPGGKSATPDEPLLH